ncbi:mediator complex subunit 13 C-terminal-domain-containing protein [Tricharina praecox]|uniref:mediator complex subunit 13 C-terminal-domain-containing protein n=1 Tax=Tricharina praecox TaxID=43433 RepID=UPI00221EF79D|nr:mediator complex subunit 13 C-terminal-domain-containing protein [Tricharina praecox]KAI5849865.1 mediator complex subunit 13 C-terminal-domain-containing protein [Tricharina praecox]
MAASTAQEKDERWLQLEKRLKEEWGLQEFSAGVFHASSLTPRFSDSAVKAGSSNHSDPTSRLPSAAVTPSIHSGTPGAGSKNEGPVMIDLTLDDPAESMDVVKEPDRLKEQLFIYGNIITAVLAAVSFGLAFREGFTPLNARTLVSPTSLPCIKEHKSRMERMGRMELLAAQPVTEPELTPPLVLELNAYMTSLGTLVVIPYSEKQSAIRRLVTCGLTRDSLRCREVFVAPWGEWGRLLPVYGGEIEEPEVKKAEENWKDKVLSYLKDRGIISPFPLEDTEKTVLQEAIEKDKWPYVEIRIPSLTDPLMGYIHHVLWPEALLFLRASEGDKKLFVAAKEHLPSLDFNDPEYSRLAWGKLATLKSTLDRGAELPKITEKDTGAEWWDVQSAVQWGHEWFKGRDLRAEKIKEHLEMKERREQAETDMSKEDRTAEIKEGKLPEPKPEPDGLSPAGSTATAGPASEPPTSAAATTDADPSTTTTTATTTLGTSGTMDHDWPGEPAPPNNDHMVPQRETDLFGEGMEDMDQFMKVTEDDFDFFDNPDFEGGNDAGGMDLDGGDLQGVGGLMHMEGGDTDLRMGTPPPTDRFLMGKTKRDKKRSRLNDPSAVKEIPSTSVETQSVTPPLSPHHAIGLLVPGYQPPSTETPSFSGDFKKPAAPAASITPVTPVNQQRRSSLYSPILFTESVEMADQKYAPGGRFFLPDTKGDEQEFDATKINKPRSIKHKRRKLESAPSELAVTITPADDDFSSGGESDDDLSSDEDSESDADDTTEDEDEESYHTSPGRTAPLLPGFLNFGKKPKLAQDSGEMDVDTPEGSRQQRDGTIGADGEVEVIQDLAPPPWNHMQPGAFDESIVGVFEHKVLTSDAMTLLSLGEGEFLEVAAMVADHMVGWMHASWRGKNETYRDDEEDAETSLIRRRCSQDQDLVEDALKVLFKEEAVVRCNLETYAAIADSIPEPPPIPPPPPLAPFGRGHQGIKPNISQRRNKDPEDEEDSKPWDIFHVPPPHVRMQRGENVLEMLPPALHFWDTFSLAPISGSKSVISFCLHPASSAMKEGADFLLEQVSSSYEAGRFGVHIRGEIEGMVEGGLVAVEIPQEAPRTYELGMKAIQGHLEGFGQALAHAVGDEGVNIVIYVINPFDHPSSLVDICTSFIRMQRLYEASIATFPDALPNQLVLQVVPAGFVAHKLGAVMRVGVAHRLAVEVYSRCIPTDPDLGFEEAKRLTSLPIQVARPIPKNIEFRQTSDPSPALLKENQLLHIAYSQSTDERWVAAAWSDNTGSVQKTAIINLARRSTAGFLRPFEEVMHEIWDTTVELIKYPAVKWRLCFTKVCSTTMPEDEIETWQTLVETHERVSAIYLLAADISSPLRIQDFSPEEVLDPKDDPSLPENQHINSATGNTSTPPIGAMSTPAGNISTPPVFGNISTPPVVTTPGPSSMLSPEASANTPGGPDPSNDLDPDAVLIDAVDESWGVVLAHTLRPRGELEKKLKYRPTGLLLRHDGGAEGDGWSVVVAVSAVEGNAAVLREVIEVWRGLGVLGQFVAGSAGVPTLLLWCAGINRLARIM